MKQQLLFALTLAIIVSSCSIEKRQIMPGYHVKSLKKKKDLNENQSNLWHKKEDVAEPQEWKNKTLFDNMATINLEEQNDETLSASVDDFYENKNLSSLSLIKPKRSYFNNSHIKNLKAPNDSCDIIILKDGSEILVKVLEISINEIKYKKCDNLNGPTISLSKYPVLMIQYPNGTKDIINPNNSTTNSSGFSTIDNTQLKTEGLGITGFITSIVGLILFGIPLGLLSIIFGGISLSKISKNPKKFKGKGLAITSIVLGLIDIVAALVVIALLL